MATSVDKILQTLDALEGSLGKIQEATLVNVPGPMSKPEKGQPELDFFERTSSEADDIEDFLQMLYDGVPSDGLVAAILKGFTDAADEGKYEDADYRTYVAKNVRVFLNQYREEVFGDIFDEEDNMLIEGSSDKQVLGAAASYLEAIAEILRG